MNLSAICLYIGYILCLEGLFMVPALLMAFYYGEPSALFAFGSSIIIAIGAGWCCCRLRPPRRGINAREGFVTVALCWIAMSLAGALPFLLSDAMPRMVDAWFESVSGFTTTGASILTAIEGLPNSILYWRSFTHWLGGMGVLVFVLAVVPLSKGSGDTLHLLRAESPGPSVDKLTPTMRHTARILYAIYIALTLLEVVFLRFGGMPLFDSVNHAFATAGTGGFSIKNASIAAYQSPYIHLVIGVFMALFGVNFGIFYLLLLRQVRQVFKNEELRLYLGLMAASTLLIAFNILPLYGGGFGRALLDSFFQVSSIMTTTGFATANFDLWPQFSRLLLVLLMIFGASAGSTGGGIKMSRLLILAKAQASELRRITRPRLVKPVMIDGKRVGTEVVHVTFAFMVAYFFICCISMILLSFDNFDLETSVTAVLACVNNIGPGLSMVGPMGNYAQFSAFSKLVLSFDMLIGRLEIFPMLMLFSPGLWRARRVV